MAGSKDWFVYEDDDDNTYGVQLDEDAGLLPAFGFAPYTGTPALDQLPRGAKMRYVNAVQTSGAGAGYRYRRFPCGNPDALAFGGTATTFTVNGLTYSVTSTVGERFKKPVAANTGLVGASPIVGGGAAGGGGTP